MYSVIHSALVIALVNLNNLVMIKGSYSKLLPAPAQTVKTLLLSGMRATGVQLLVRDQLFEATAAAGCIVVTVPPILDHEVIAVDLEPVNFGRQ